jgi:hypothetical protein
VSLRLLERLSWATTVLAFVAAIAAEAVWVSFVAIGLLVLSISLDGVAWVKRRRTRQDVGPSDEG